MLTNRWKISLWSCVTHNDYFQFLSVEIIFKFVKNMRFLKSNVFVKSVNSVYFNFVNVDPIIFYKLRLPVKCTWKTSERVKTKYLIKRSNSTLWIWQQYILLNVFRCDKKDSIRYSWPFYKREMNPPVPSHSKNHKEDHLVTALWFHLRN